MKSIIIVCEGETEAEFCKTILQPYFKPKEIFIKNPLIERSNGGIVAWKILKKQIENHLQQDKNTFVTTLIDYYGIKASHNYPNWEDIGQTQDVAKNGKIDVLENAMKNDISASLRDRFIPYVQLHEFESLLFVDLNVLL